MNTKIESFSYILYCVANILLLMNPGVFWDDWTLYNMDDRGIMSQFYGNGGITTGYLHIFLKNVWGSPMLYHVLTFILQLLSLFLLFRIHEKFKMRKKFSLFFLFTILIYAVLPVFDSKVTMIVFPYTLRLTSFLIAFVFLLKYFENRKRIDFRILSLLFFFFSFFTNSLLVFYLIPIFLVIFLPFWQRVFSENLISDYSIFVRKMIGQVLLHLDFFVLPFLFWLLRSLYFQPSQVYAAVGYNKIKVESILELPFRFVLSGYVFFVSLVPLIREALQVPEIWLIFLGVAVFINVWFKNQDFSFKISWKLLFWGLVVYGIGIFPYLMVNKIPGFGWNSARHQLLIGFGLCIIIMALLLKIKAPNLKKVFFSLLMGGFAAFTFFLHFSYFKGYIKQTVLMSYFESQNFSSDQSQTILYHDKTDNFTQKGNPSNFYELSGILKLSHPEEKIMLVKKDDFYRYEKSGFFKKLEPYFYSKNLSNYEITKPSLELEVIYSKKTLPTFPILKFYGDYLSGNKENWEEYFQFNLLKL